MLLSNWDTKDARDLAASGPSWVADSNLAIFQTGSPDKPRYLYFVSDWGASLGKWGSALATRSKGNCRDYASQTANFVQGTSGAEVRIRPSDVQWLLKSLGSVTDDQLRQGLASSGATPEELACYLTALRQRIDQLKGIEQR